MTKYCTLIFGLMALFTSCGEIDLKKELANLYAQPIHIPTEMTVTYNGQDTLINNLFDTKLKLIVYVDSVGCASCDISKMYIWNSFLEYAQQYNGALKYYFIFHPAQGTSSKVRTSMKLNRLNYPMLLDLNGDFEKLNPHLPKIQALHTFLLDENNKVILVGNPLYNKDVEKLFYNAVEEKLKNTTTVEPTTDQQNVS